MTTEPIGSLAEEASRGGMPAPDPPGPAPSARTPGPGSDPAPVSRPAVALRRIFHAAVALGGWWLFFYWWWQVLSFTHPVDAALAALFIGGTLAATVLLTLLWVRHNLGIHRRKGPRTRLREVSEGREADVLGRSLILRPDGEALRRAPLVLVSVDGEEKRLEAGGDAR